MRKFCSKLLLLFYLWYYHASYVCARMCALMPCVCVCVGVPSLWVLWDLRLKDNNPAESLVSGDVKGCFLAVLVEESRTRECWLEDLHSLSSLKGNEEVIQYHLRGSRPRHYLRQKSSPLILRVGFILLSGGTISPFFSSLKRNY